MTVIAYRGGTLACDSAWSERGTVVSSQTKLTRLASGVLIGASGDGDDRELMALLTDVKTPADLPSAAKLISLRCTVGLLVVFPDGAVWRVGTGKKDGGAEPTHEPCAIGSGSDLALGAMLGNEKLSAAEACAISCLRDTNCKEPIHTMSVDARTQKAS